MNLSGRAVLHPLAIVPLTLLRGAGTASWVPQFTLSPETLTLGLQAERALGAAGCPRSQDGALAAPGGTEANAGGRGLPSPSCLETKQTLLSCPPAPGILLRTRPFRSVTLGRSGEEIELSKRWWGEGGRGAPETPVAEDGGARTAESPRGGGRSPATPRAHGRSLLDVGLPHPPAHSSGHLSPADGSVRRPVPGTKHPLFSWGGLTSGTRYLGGGPGGNWEVSQRAGQVDGRQLEADGAPEAGGGQTAALVLLPPPMSGQGPAAAPASVCSSV